MSGAPLDPTRTFAFADLVGADADTVAADARHFLVTAGYVVVTGVFDTESVTGLRASARRVEHLAVPGDTTSWWGRTADGAEVLNRAMNGATQPDLAALHHDDRVRRVAELAPEPLQSRRMDGVHPVTVLWKRPNVTEGLGDLPWHRDCGMGGHAINCPTTVMTVCLTDGSPEAGELRALPGSHRGSYPFIDGRDEAAPSGVGLAVTAGDVSLHYSDVMHASLPPTSQSGPHRVSALLAFVPADAGHHRGGRHYNDVLLGGEGGQVEHLADKLS